MIQSQSSIPLSRFVCFDGNRFTCLMLLSLHKNYVLPHNWFSSCSSLLPFAKIVLFLSISAFCNLALSGTYTVCRLDLLQWRRRQRS